MQEHVKRRAHRERLALSSTELEVSGNYAPDVVYSPALTHKPELDDSLGKITVMTHRVLSKMDIAMQKVEDGDMPDRRLLRDFKDLCETVQRQAKTMIEIEKHLKSKQDAMTPEQIRDTIVSALREQSVPEKVVNTVLLALGMSPTT